MLNILSRNNRAKLLRRVQSLLADNGRAYVLVARNVPRAGKLGVQHCMQNYVVLSLPVVHEDTEIAIYELSKHAAFEDRTQDFVSRRDARRDA